MSHTVVGRIGAPYGLKGWVKVVSFTKPRENILHYRPWLLLINGQWHENDVLQAKIHGASIVAHFSGYCTPESAKQLGNVEIGIKLSTLPVLPEGEYYWSELVGLTVINTKQQILGNVHHLFETGANDVLVVKGEKEMLIPYIPHVVFSVDLEKQVIVVDWE